jgi:hypothetical protein
MTTKRLTAEDLAVIELSLIDKGVIRAVNKYNCRALFDANRERVEYFARRAAERGMSGADVVIVLLNVDDPYGAAIAELLMPNHNWQSYRDRGEIPVARGLAGREGIFEAVGAFDLDAAEKMRLSPNKLLVVTVDYGVAEVYDVSGNA